MKSAKLMIALAMTMVPMIASAQLRSSDKIVTQVPFEFVAGNKVVPAGKCVMQAANSDIKTFLIRNTDAKVSLFAMISADEGKQVASHYALVFHRYGDRNFLYGMKVEGSDITYRVPQGKAETELRAQNVPSTDTILLASLN